MAVVLERTIKNTKIRMIIFVIRRLNRYKGYSSGSCLGRRQDSSPRQKKRGHRWKRSGQGVPGRFHLCPDVGDGIRSSLSFWYGFFGTDVGEQSLQLRIGHRVTLREIAQ